MPARDIFHHAVRIGLEKQQWVITQDPLYLKLSAKVEMYIDLAAEKLLSAQKDDRKIAVEVKSFLGLSAISEFHTAVGQFLNYRVALKKLEPERALYLAIPTDIYNKFFSEPFIQEVIREYNLKLIVFDSQQEEVTLWKD
ncbi:MAG: XisH family protein [Cyanobacteriota bacterium]|nr:XisH family protein [Cyanobacteriota bacterium]